MKDIEVSILIPIYNGEKFLGKCVESIKAQTIKDIEILLLNDGSTDSSAEMCDEYAVNDCRIRVVHKENEGLAETRNRGIKEASAPFIFFLDCDDWIEKNALELLLEAQKREDADVVLGSFIMQYKDKSVINNKNEKYEVLSRKESLNYIILDKKITSYVCGNIYRKSLFSGIVFPRNRQYEDYATSYLIFENANKVVCTNYAIYNYLQHSDSIIHSPNPKNEYDFFKAELERYDFVHSHTEYFENPKPYHIHAAKTVLRLLKRILLLTEKGEMEEEISQMQKFLKSLTDVKCFDIGIDRYIKIKLSIYCEDIYRSFLKITKRKEKVYKTDS